MQKIARSFALAGVLGVMASLAHAQVTYHYRVPLPGAKAAASPTGGEGGGGGGGGGGDSSVVVTELARMTPEAMFVPKASMGCQLINEVLFNQSALSFSAVYGDGTKIGSGPLFNYTWMSEPNYQMDGLYVDYDVTYTLMNLAESDGIWLARGPEAAEFWDEFPTVVGTTITTPGTTTIPVGMCSKYGGGCQENLGTLRITLTPTDGVSSPTTVDIPLKEACY